MSAAEGFPAGGRGNNGKIKKKGGRPGRSAGGAALAHHQWAKSSFVNLLTNVSVTAIGAPQSAQRSLSEEPREANTRSSNVSPSPRADQGPSSARRSRASANSAFGGLVKR